MNGYCGQLLRVNLTTGEITKEQIEHFFEHYKDLEPGKWVKIGDWHGAEVAKQLIVEAIERAKA